MELNISKTKTLPQAFLSLRGGGKVRTKRKVLVIEEPDEKMA